MTLTFIYTRNITTKEHEESLMMCLEERDHNCEDMNN